MAEGTQQVEQHLERKKHKVLCCGTISQEAVKGRSSDDSDLCQHGKQWHDPDPKCQQFPTPLQMLLDTLSSFSSSFFTTFVFIFCYQHYHSLWSLDQ